MRSPELAGDPSVGQVQTDRQLGVTLVDTVADPQPAADPLRRIEAVDVDALVEVRELVGLVRIFVARLQPHALGRHRSLFVWVPRELVTRCGTTGTGTSASRSPRARMQRSVACVLGA